MYSKILVGNMVKQLAFGAVGGGTHVVSNLENPQLLFKLPMSIINDAIGKDLKYAEPHVFNCDRRAELHDFCLKNGIDEDQFTIPAVNKYLDKQGTPLTEEDLLALKLDILLKSTMPEDTHPQDRLRLEASSQLNIAKSFNKSGEKEGGLLHLAFAGMKIIGSGAASNPFEEPTYMTPKNSI